MKCVLPVIALFCLQHVAADENRPGGEAASVEIPLTKPATSPLKEVLALLESHKKDCVLDWAEIERVQDEWFEGQRDGGTAFYKQAAEWDGLRARTKDANRKRLEPEEAKWREVVEDAKVALSASENEFHAAAPRLELRAFFHRQEDSATGHHAADAGWKVDPRTCLRNERNISCKRTFSSGTITLKVAGEETPIVTFIQDSTVTVEAFLEDPAGGVRFSGNIRTPEVEARFTSVFEGDVRFETGHTIGFFERKIVVGKKGAEFATVAGDQSIGSSGSGGNHFRYDGETYKGLLVAGKDPLGATGPR